MRRGNKPTFATKKAGSRRSRRTRRNIPPRSPGTTGLFGLIARGVRILTSYLPGQAIIKPLVDFGFKALGLATVSVTKGQISGTTSIFGLGSSFELTLKDVLTNSSSHGVRSQDDNFHKGIWSTYSEGKLLNLRLQLVNSGKMADKQGSWAMCFIPYRRDGDAEYYKTNTTIPDLDNVRCIPGAKFGPITERLNLNFRPRMLDGQLFQAIPLDKPIGLVMISFSDVNRNEYLNFSAEEFSCCLQLSGAVHLARPYPGAGYTYYNDKIADKLEGYGMIVNYGRGFLLLKDEMFKIQKGSGGNSLVVKRDGAPTIPGDDVPPDEEGFAVMDY